MSFSFLENCELQEVFLQKLTQFSYENNVLDAVVVNVDGFVLRDTFVPSTQLNRPTWHKTA
jgi:hypothetical protein